MSREAMKQALEALESDPISHAGLVSRKQAITALRQALVDADDTSQKRVDEMVKTEHDRAVELGKAYERGWNAALAQQEPVAWISDSPTKGNGKQLHWTKSEAWRWSSNITPLYTAPPKQWVGLTDEEREFLLHQALRFYDTNAQLLSFIKTVEEKLREKNA